MSNDLMISVSGVRGIVGRSLTPTLLVEEALAFSRLVQGGTVVLARDTRPSGEMARHAVLAGLMAGGCRVIDIGVVPTPTAQLAVEHHHAAGGIVITASHNPAEWNALKFIGPDGLFLPAARAARREKIHQDRAWRLAPHHSLGAHVEDRDAVDRHRRAILALPEVAPASIRNAGFTVALDCVNGAGAVMIPDLLEELGCRVEVIHGEPDGRFGRGTEPVPENLGDLSNLVRRTGAIIGLALDPDGDRLALVGPDGVPLGEEATLVLALTRLLAFRKGAVIVNLSTSMRTEEVARRFGAPHVRTPVGEANVTAAMKRRATAGGGEGNGGVIHPGLHLGRDAPVAAALILSLLAEGENDPRSILAKLPPAAMVKVKLALERRHLPALGKALARELPGARIDRRDGLRFAWKDRWLHVRGSGTEPVVRIIAEAPAEGAARELVRSAEVAAKSLGTKTPKAPAGRSRRGRRG